MPIEGTLSLAWVNWNVSAPPRYQLLFSRYANPRDGALQPLEIIGDPALENYLVKQLGFTTETAKRWMDRVHRERNAVLIHNVIMLDECLAEYEPPNTDKAAGA